MGSTLTIAHCFDSEWSGREVALPVAQLRMRDGGCVGLYWRRGSGRWSPYRREHEAPFHGTLLECLAEIAADRWGCFWN